VLAIRFEVRAVSGAPADAEPTRRGSWPPSQLGELQAMNVPAELLRELHRLLRQLADLRSQWERGPRQVKATEQLVGQRNEEVTRAKQAVTKSRMTCDERELQLKQREAHIRDMRAKLNACSTNREYQILREQIAADEQANSVLSDEILELWEKVSEQEKQVAQAKQQLAQGNADLEKTRARVQERRQSLEFDLARLTGELAEAEAKLSPDVRQEFQRMVKTRGDEALAPLEAECCGGCHQTVTPQMLNELPLSRLVACKSCGRWLYQPE